MNIQTMQANGPQTLKSNNTRSYITLQVFGDGILYYGSSIAEITSSQTDVTQYRGFQVTANDGIQRFWINKPLVVLSSVGGMILAYDVDDFTD